MIPTWWQVTEEWVVTASCKVCSLRVQIFAFLLQFFVCFVNFTASLMIKLLRWIFTTPLNSQEKQRNLKCTGAVKFSLTSTWQPLVGESQLNWLFILICSNSRKMSYKHVCNFFFNKHFLRTSKRKMVWFSLKQLTTPKFIKPHLSLNRKVK